MKCNVPKVFILKAIEEIIPERLLKAARASGIDSYAVRFFDRESNKRYYKREDLLRKAILKSIDTNPPEQTEAFVKELDLLHEYELYKSRSNTVVLYSIEEAVEYCIKDRLGLTEYSDSFIDEKSEYLKSGFFRIAEKNIKTLDKSIAIKDLLYLYADTGEDSRNVQKEGLSTYEQEFMKLIHCDIKTIREIAITEYILDKFNLIELDSYVMEVMKFELSDRIDFKDSKFNCFDARKVLEYLKIDDVTLEWIERHSHSIYETRDRGLKEVKLTKTTVIQEYGLTETLIKKYLPEPEKVRNPNYSTSSPMQLWKKSTVERIIRNTPELQKRNSEKKRRKEEKERKERELSEKVTSYLQLFDIERLRTKAKMLDRRFVLHVGPTNSGKTYDAIETLKKAKRGVYLGPLRLLALEMYEKLNGQGYSCDLLTGEESIRTENAGLTSSTIELCDYSQRYDVAVIDEAQLISDSMRGSSWSKAIYLCNAKEVHICMAPEAENLICQILKSFNAVYEVMRHERLAPLSFLNDSFDLKDAKSGDALILFSRAEVLSTASVLSENGIFASVIYGDLPPVSRKEEIRKFENGETTVIVSTDAIGMGVSLPIKRVIFLETEKFDGVVRRKLNVAEIKQIAGRAGRFGIQDKGEVLTVKDSEMIRMAIDANVKDINKIVIPFPEEAVELDVSVLKMLKMWQDLPKTDNMERADMKNAIFLLEYLGKQAEGIDKRLLLKLISCPLDIKNYKLVMYWYESVTRIISGKKPEKPDYRTDYLEGCELQYRALDLRHQMLRITGVEEDCMPEKLALCKKINGYLLERKRNKVHRCSCCGKPLFNDFYVLCNECYRKNGDKYYDARWF